MPNGNFYSKSAIEL